MNLTFQLDYLTHQDYANFRFFYAWQFSERCYGGWILHTQPRFTRAFGENDPQLVGVPSLSEREHVLWRHALALRKARALALANAYQVVDTAVFKRDWESDVSSCWSAQMYSLMRLGQGIFAINLSRIAERGSMHKAAWSWPSRTTSRDTGNRTDFVRDLVARTCALWLTPRSRRGLRRPPLLGSVPVRVPSVERHQP
eukprot:743641-Rhodomonas_salina.2